MKIRRTDRAILYEKYQLEHPAACGSGDERTGTEFRQGGGRKAANFILCCMLILLVGLAAIGAVALALPETRTILLGLIER